MPTLKTKIPPPLVAFLAGLLMWLLARLTPGLTFPLPHHRLLAAIVALTGVMTALAAITSFRRARTTVNPLHPERASSLVTNGIFRLTRNPMYLALLLVLIAWFLYLSNGLALIILPAFVLYITHFQIRPEEQALSSTFGPSFDTYKSSVRRWL